MTESAAIAGSYADFKLVKSRSVAQAVIEIPIEQAEAFLKAFGVPQPGSEKPVALALLREEPKQEKPKVPFREKARAQQAGILCSDERFQKWLQVPDADHAAEEVRRVCGVLTRANLDDEPAATRWDMLEARYRVATGQMAEAR